MIGRDLLETELESVLSKSWQVTAFGREHLLPGTGLPAKGALRFSPDFLVQARHGNYRDGGPIPPEWSIFLECKRSKYETLSINKKALQGYEKWQALSGITVYIVTCKGPIKDCRTLDPFFVLPVSKILNSAYTVSTFPTLDPRTGRMDCNVRSDACVMVPKDDFVWPLEDLMDQKVQGKKRPQMREVKPCN